MSHQVLLPSYSVENELTCQVAEVLKKYGKRVLVVGGKTALSILQPNLEKTFKENHLEVTEFRWYGGECTRANIQEIASQAVGQQVELIVGVGGGKSLDTAKAAADQAGIKCFTIPTIAATCAATTPLSVIYDEQGRFESLMQLAEPPTHIFVDVSIMAQAPPKYLWAGIGDTLAKYYEVEYASRGKKLEHHAAMGKTLSSMCAEPLLQYGVQALKDNEAQKATFELQQVVLNNIISTGLVAMLVGEENNGAIAHGVFYGLTALEQVEQKCLHGEVVAYGIIVMLTIDGQETELTRLQRFYKETHLPLNLRQLGVSLDHPGLEEALEKAANAPDMKKGPYTVTKEMLYEAMVTVEGRTDT